ncbi:MAG: pantetheine-phosphate adenylyltransferase [Dehalococcoidales bacterium]|jgi:pantetheine-phosphate adenylyltransferase|nr:pantetheine-phosphate adenylyltransferase [Dehalococcoidales bacterium]
MEREERVAIYAGTFDPITLGHLWMIEAGAQMFDRLIVAVGTNPEKSCYFSTEDRIEMIQDSVKDIKNVIVDNYTDKFLIKYAEKIGAKYILRGIRSTADYEYEKSLSYVNRYLNTEIVTVFILPPRELIEISSSIVRGLIGPEGWEDVVKNYVPECVFKKLIEEHKKRTGC